MEAKAISDVRNMRKAIMLAVENEKFKKQLAQDPAKAIDDYYAKLNFKSGELNKTALGALKSLTDDELRALSRIPDIARRGGYDPLEFF
jgi:hypothetical protein